MGPAQDAALWIFDPGRLLTFVLVLCRVGGLVTAMPMLDSASAPRQVRALLAVALTLLAAPVQFDKPVPDPGTMLNALAFIVHEVTVGVAAGLAVRLFLSAFQLAGQAVSQTAGLSLSEIFNPTMGGSGATMSVLLYWLAMAVFLILGGHRLAIRGFLDTFETLPLGQDVAALLAPEALHQLVSASLELGVRVAAPCVTALLTATLVTSLLSRTVPQLNMMLGLGVNAMLVLGALALSLGGIAWACEEQIEPFLATFFDALTPEAEP